MTNESAQLNVLISGGFAGAYGELLPEFQRMSDIKVTTGSGASQGSGPQTIAAQRCSAGARQLLGRAAVQESN
jgi:molybdate transport system substrate-binding protein